MQRDAPVVIGCIGGSGSRALQQILAQAGIFMGVRLNDARDAMDFEPFLDQVIEPILQATKTLAYDPHKNLPNTSPGYLAMLKRIADHYLSDIRAAVPVWGWKCPRNLYVLPLIHALYPKMRFIHLVRDGRDIALSWNRQQVNRYYTYFFGPQERPSNPVYNIQFWDKINCDVADWAQAMLGPRYHLVRYEDLCLQPEEEIEKIAAFLGQKWNTGDLTSCVVPSPSLGKFRELPEPQIHALTSVGKAGLERFGYS